MLGILKNRTHTAFQGSDLTPEQAKDYVESNSKMQARMEQILTPTLAVIHHEPDSKTSRYSDNSKGGKRAWGQHILEDHEADAKTKRAM